MKNKVLTTCLSLMWLTSFSQSTDFDSRLLAKFSEPELTAMSSDQLAFWNFYVGNSYEIVDIPEGKQEGIKLSLDVSVNETDLNTLKLGLEPHEYVRKYYRLKGTNDKMLMLLSIKDVERAMGKR